MGTAMFRRSNSSFIKSLSSEISSFASRFKDRVDYGDDTHHFNIVKHPKFTAVIRPKSPHKGWMYAIKVTMESEEPSSIAEIEVSKSKGKYGDPTDKVKDFSVPVSKLGDKIKSLINDFQKGYWDGVEQLKDLAKVLQSSIITFLDLKVEYQSSGFDNRQEYSWPQSVDIAIYGPGMRKSPSGLISYASIQDPKKVLEPNVFHYSQQHRIAGGATTDYEDISESEVISKVKKFVKAAEKMWETPELRAKIDAKFTEFQKQEERRLQIEKEYEERDRLRAEQDRIRKEDAEKALRLEQEEKARKKEEADKRRSERENKTTVNSAAQEKIGILETLAAKSPKPEVKALANMIREMYESGQKPDDEQLKRIRNYLYTVGMRPQADHFRVASSKSVVQRWLRRFR